MATPSTNCKTCKEEFLPAYPKQVFCPKCTSAHKEKHGPVVKAVDVPKPAPKAGKDYHTKPLCSTPHCNGKQKCAFLTLDGYAVGFCYKCLCKKLNLKPTIPKE